MYTDSTITWSEVDLLDSAGNVVSSQTNVSSSCTFSNLSAGDYTIALANNQYSTTHKFHLDGNFVIASIGAPAIIYTKEDVVFNALVTNANHFNWDFGDGTLIVGVCNPDQVYLVPGTYTVNLSCSNDNGCSATAQVTVIVELASGIADMNAKGATVTADGKTVVVNMNGATLTNAEVRVYNLLGQSVYNQPLGDQQQTINLSEQSSGYYLISVKNNNKVSTKRVFLTK
jgi:PKD repeat protein